MFFPALAGWAAPGHGHHGKPTPTPSPTPVPTPIPIPPSVTLAWDASSDSSVVGYHLWMGFVSGGERQATPVGNVTVWTVQLSGATTYFFFVTAYNGQGDSLPSNEISYTTP